MVSQITCEWGCDQFGTTPFKCFIAHARYSRTKESATSATDNRNALSNNILLVHFDFQKMLLEKLLAGANIQLHI